MDNSIKQTINNLPSSWEQFSFKQYISILDCKIINDTASGDMVDNYNRAKEALSVLSGLSNGQLDALPLSTMNKALNRLSFLSQPMPSVKVTHKIKKTEEVTFQNFVSYIDYSKNMETYIRNFPAILPLFINITEDEVNDLPAHYVFALIEQVKKKLRRSVLCSMPLMMLKVMIMKLKEMIGRLKSIVKRRK